MIVNWCSLEEKAWLKKLYDSDLIKVTDTCKILPKLEVFLLTKLHVQWASWGAVALNRSCYYSFRWGVILHVWPCQAWCWRELPNHRKSRWCHQDQGSLVGGTQDWGCDGKDVTKCHVQGSAMKLMYWTVWVCIMVMYCYHPQLVASFPGPTQLSVTCSTVKRGEPGIFSHVSMT